MRINKYIKKKTILTSDKKIVRNFNYKSKKLSNKHLTFLEKQKVFQEIKKNVKIENFHGLAIDSRLVKKNNLFLTIRGKNHDGSNFISSALDKGAKQIVSSKKLKKYKNKIIKVKNEVKFLNSFAKKKERSRAKILAITGSAGKTSLKI